MNGLTTAMLSEACRIFLTFAYPDGGDSVPAAKRLYRDSGAETPLETLLAPPVCQPIATNNGRTRGFAWRLGCKGFPHLKLQVTSHDGGECVFSVDTHDAVRVPADHPDAPRWAQLQAANRQLKEQIESAWQQSGFLTFNGLLRRDLDRIGPKGIIQP